MSLNEHLENQKECINFVITITKENRYGSVSCQDRKFKRDKAE
jgi:hypothetical protein